MARQGAFLSLPRDRAGSAPTSAACVLLLGARRAPLSVLLPLLWLPLKSPRSRGHRGPVLRLPSLDDLGGGDHLLGGHNHRNHLPSYVAPPAVLRETGSL